MRLSLTGRHVEVTTTTGASACGSGAGTSVITAARGGCDLAGVTVIGAGACGSGGGVRATGVADHGRNCCGATKTNAGKACSAVLGICAGETLTMSDKADSNMRLAAYLLAVQRVADATAMRGLYP